MPLSQNARVGLIVGGVAAALFVVCAGGVVALVVWKGGGGETGGGEIAFRPSEGREGEAWTIRDIGEHVEKNGPVKADRISYGNWLGQRPQVSFTQGERMREVLEIAQLDSSQKAREYAASRGTEARFSWGRFAISGDKWAVDAAKKALGL